MIRIWFIETLYWVKAELKMVLARKPRTSPLCTQGQAMRDVATGRGALPNYNATSTQPTPAASAAVRSAWSCVASGN